MKKILLVLPLVVLLAAGCNSASTNNNNSQTGQSNSQPSSETMASSSSVSAKNKPAISASSTWQSMLQASNNSTKGQYMIVSVGHTIYLKTGRDYSSLLGKQVNVSYNGNLDSFTLVNITAQ
jgi:hypothetical protein